MIDWAMTWGLCVAVVAIGWALSYLFEPSRRMAGRVCRLMNDGLGEGDRWCECTSCGQCVQCPEEDRP